MESIKKEYTTAGEVYVNNGRYSLVSAQSKLTWEFSSLCDVINVRITGTVYRGRVKIEFYGVKSDGDKKLLEYSFADGAEFAAEFEADPPNLAVYADVVSFELSVSPDGECAELSLGLPELAERSIGNYGETAKSLKTGVKPVPSSMLIVGNSLVFGMKMQFGMCATSAERDYYHYVTEYVKGKNPGCRFNKLYVSMFESCETLEGVKRWLDTDPNNYTGKPSSESFTPELDLITLQLGDNVNTEEKIAVFAESGDLLINRIKEQSPRARIIIIHGWYNKPRVYDLIVSLCERHGIERVFIGDLRSYDTESHTDESFALPDGTVLPISDTWRTHPGDKGMKLIAERIIENLSF